jgi:hypothetical protein
MFLKSKWAILALAASVVGCGMGLQATTVGESSLPPPLVLPLVVPPAKEKYRGLLSEIEICLVLHFARGEVLAVEPVTVNVRSAFDPLPEILDLEADVRSWARHTLQQWKAMRIDPFRLEVRLEFRTDPALDDAAVVYRIEYDRHGPDPGAYHPARISITAAPGDVAGWRKTVEDFRQHEQKLRRLREELGTAATMPRP